MRVSRRVARWWMGTGSPIDLTSPEAERRWRELARGEIGRAHV